MRHLSAIALAKLLQSTLDKDGTNTIHHAVFAVGQLATFRHMAASTELEVRSTASKALLRLVQPHSGTETTWLTAVLESVLTDPSLPAILPRWLLADEPEIRMAAAGLLAAILLPVNKPRISWLLTADSVETLVQAAEACSETDAAAPWVFGAVRLMSALGHEVATVLLSSDVLQRVLVPRLSTTNSVIQIMVLEALASLSAEDSCRTKLFSAECESCVSTLIELLASPNSSVPVLRAVSSIIFRCSINSAIRKLITQRNGVAILTSLFVRQGAAIDARVRLNLIKALECLLFESEARQQFLECDGIRLLTQVLPSCDGEGHTAAHWILCRLAHDGTCLFPLWGVVLFVSLSLSLSLTSGMR